MRACRCRRSVHRPSSCCPPAQAAIAVIMLTVLRPGDKVLLFPTRRAHEAGVAGISVKDVDLFYRVKATTRVLGIGVSPDDCFLMLREPETMGVRVAHVGRVALEQAHWLAKSPATASVLHPALPDSPGHVWRTRRI